ncbi:MAG TPA: hypothetical protein VFM94_07225 [Solirubrobacterales bacterium]|nr:hypothetical protein [Solirubrobacterales bacterium]
MDRSSAMAEARRLEDELLQASERIRDVGSTDSLAGWLVEVLKKDRELARQFALPTDPKVTKALLVLLETASSLRTPLVTLLAQRTSAFIATIHDIAEHPFSSDRVSTVEENMKGVVDLLADYEVNYDRRKTIPLVAESLREHRTNIYKISPQESDLRVTLRAFYEDDARDDVEAIDFLLEFVLRELLEEVRRPGHLPQPRHSWWAVQTLFCEGRLDWLQGKRPSLNKVVAHLVSQLEYRPSRELDYTSFVPELYSAANEELWAAINGCKVLSSGRAWLLTEANARGVLKRVRQGVSGVLSQQGYSNLKLTQSRLILLYEALIYEDLQTALRMATAPQLDLAGACIGIRYYEESVTRRFAEIKTQLANLLQAPTRWDRGTLSSMLLSGGPGQGKSELIRQLVDEFEGLVTARGFAFDAAQFAAGKELIKESDLTSALDWPGSDETVFCRVFDEIDKANFDFFAHFLALLETPDANRKTIWLFAQSSQSTFEDLKEQALREQKMSMRDFLTRIQLGHIDMPSLKFSPAQKVYSSLGLAKGTDSGLRNAQRELILELTQRADVQTNRDLKRIVTNECEVDDGIVRLKEASVFSLGDYLIESKRIRPRRSPLRVRF